MVNNYYDRIQSLIEMKNFNSLGDLAKDIQRFCTDAGIEGTVTKSTLSAYTLNPLKSDYARRPSYESIYILSRYFNVSADYILGLSSSASTNNKAAAAAEYLEIDDKTISALLEIFCYDREKLYIEKYIQTKDFINQLKSAANHLSTDMSNFESGHSDAYDPVVGYAEYIIGRYAIRAYNAVRSSLYEQIEEEVKPKQKKPVTAKEDKPKSKKGRKESK